MHDDIPEGDSADLRRSAGDPAVAGIEPQQGMDGLRLLSLAVEQTSEGIAVVDLEGILQFVNPAFAKMHGYAPEELIGKHLSIFHSPEQMPTVDEANRTLQESGVFAGEVRHTRRDGTSFSTMMRNSLLRDVQGTPIGMIGTVADISELRRAEKALNGARDELEQRVIQRTHALTEANQRLEQEITDRKRAQEALRVSEERSRTIVDASKDAMIAIDQSGRIILFNPAAEKMLGHGKDEMIGQPLDALIPEKYREAHRGYVSGFFREGEPAGAIGKTVELPALRRDGSEFPIDLSLSVGQSGDQRFVLAVIRDVTRRKRAESALRESEAKIRALVETTSDWIWEVDSDGFYTYASPKVKDLLGYDPEEMIGKTPFDFMPPDVAGEVKAVFQQGAASREPFAGLENVNLHKDGHPVVIETSGVPILDAKGNLLGYRGIDRDITIRKQAEQQIRQAKEAAEAANRAKSIFLANVSHEIRTPIVAILGSAEMSVRSDDDQAGRIDHAETILRNGRHLLALVDDLLDAARLDEGRLEIAPVDCSLAEIIADVRALIEPLHQNRDVEFGVAYDGEIPVVIHTDPLRLKQAVINLINNALKFTQTGHVYVNVGVDRRAEEPRLSISVEDTGAGIPAGKLESIFELFAQVGPASDQVSGSMGLGLPLAEWIANRLGGTVEVESQEGQGSVFTLRVATGPVNDAEWFKPDEAEAAPVPTSLPDMADHTLRVTGSVLVAEDFRDSRRLMGQVFRNAGAEVTTVSNGKEAVEEASGREFDLILMDIRMPVMSGMEAIAELRRRGYLSPIIALTASTSQRDHQQILKAGFDDLWIKPVSMKAVVEQASAYLETPADETPDPSLPGHSPPQRLHTKQAIESISAEFIRGLPSRLQAVKSAIESEDAQRAHEILHQLAGAGGVFGLMSLSEAAARLLAKSTAGTLGDCAEELRALEKLIAGIDAPPG